MTTCTIELANKYKDQIEAIRKLQWCGSEANEYDWYLVVARIFPSMPLLEAFYSDLASTPGPQIQGIVGPGSRTLQ